MKILMLLAMAFVLGYFIGQQFGPSQREAHYVGTDVVATPAVAAIGDTIKVRFEIVLSDSTRVLVSTRQLEALNPGDIWPRAEIVLRDSTLVRVRAVQAIPQL